VRRLPSCCICWDPSKPCNQSIGRVTE
jgi:hypothetical protein